MFRILFIIYQCLRLLLSIVWTVIVQLWPRNATALSHHDPNAPSSESLRDGHERSDAKPMPVAIMAAVLVVVIFATMGALGWMYMRLYSPAPAIPVKQTQEEFGNAPHSRTSIEDDWKAINAQSHQHLDGYGWVDQEHGVVRIPIQRAMDLVAAQGLPARPATTPPAFPPPDQEKLPLIDTETKQQAPTNGSD
jgi:hypothetical protein